MEALYLGIAIIQIVDTLHVSCYADYAYYGRKIIESHNSQNQMMQHNIQPKPYKAFTK
jgi:hypothetical protein